ncbi:DUF1837 domain-containing protein [Hymenobacter sp. DH14]|uniref:DUF1837 domain-containing protein n=1 Tax=Hymenobacter cyanobacteriorum TaxID=2926463 RepID=A0A9X1VGM7_9BACT|nr:DUF1837 domain-containing protein [Hymenobacter cyanobacteriorum]MCI1187788.1 DUF1837 domain-containing protein [Hymenobacter cyanobacteriorum]
MISAEQFDWKKLIRIDRTWVTGQLANHFLSFDGKVIVRAYTLKASGTVTTPFAIAEVLANMIAHYVHGEMRTQNLGETRAVLSAIKYFGEKDTNTDGKFGELLLFALVEAVLGCKMVAHKLRSLSNYKDQVKGGDGIFLGHYTIEGEEYAAYLIGESKIMGRYNAALEDACKSIDRFHEPSKSSEFFNTELIVAKDNLLLDNAIDLDELYDRLTPTSDLFKKQVLVHPILIMHDWIQVEKLENAAKTNESLEKAIKAEIEKKKGYYTQSIKNMFSKYPRIQKVYLDFFIIPFKDVKEFRNALYYHIHGVHYQE